MYNRLSVYHTLISTHTGWTQRRHTIEKISLIKKVVTTINLAIKKRFGLIHTHTCITHTSRTARCVNVQNQQSSSSTLRLSGATYWSSTILYRLERLNSDWWSPCRFDPSTFVHWMLAGHSPSSNWSAVWKLTIADRAHFYLEILLENCDPLTWLPTFSSKCVEYMKVDSQIGGEDG